MPENSTFLGFDASNDGGATWNHTCFNTVSGAGDGDPGVGYDLNGVAYISGIDAGAFAIDFEKSTNNGKTWSATAVAVPSLNGGLTDKPWLEIDTNPASKFKNSLYISITQFDASSDSQITLTYSHNGGKARKLGFTGPLQTFPGSVDRFSDRAYMKMMVATSTDGGKTWKSKPVAPASDTHDQFFQWNNVNSKGVVGVSFMDRRNDAANVNYEAFAGFSTNGGASFGKNVDLSAAP